MNHHAQSLRPFVGCRDFAVSRAFYRAWGFDELEIGSTLSLMRTDGAVFYLQDYRVDAWIDNTMLFLEVERLDEHLAATRALDLPSAFPGVRVSDVREEDWGREYFVHDPAGVLWHVGEFAGG